MEQTQSKGFKALEIPLAVDTTVADPMEKAFIPLLSNSAHYDVAVGYFTSAWIRSAAIGIAKMAELGGKARWVISPNLTEDDYEMFKSLESEECSDLVSKKALLEFDSLLLDLDANTLVGIAKLVRAGAMEFRFAIPKNRLRGLFHAKVGIFRDFDGNEVMFTGSYNHTGAAGTNWENLDFFFSWESRDRLRINQKKDLFEKVWNCEDDNLTVYRPNEAFSRGVINLVKKSVEKILDAQSGNHEKSIADGEPDRFFDSELHIPLKYLDKDGRLRLHQQKAIDSWLQNKGRGILKLATGAGKTVTAVTMAVKMATLHEKNKIPILIVVTVPYLNLAEQWVKEMKDFGFDPVRCADSKRTWESQLAQQIQSLLSFKIKYVVAVCVENTFFEEKFISRLSSLPIQIMWIADEVHNTGTARRIAMFPSNVNLRVGLSATPERYNDSIGTEAVLKYFGGIVSEYSLENALNDSTLCPYDYYPVLVELTELESSDYIDLSRKIARLVSFNGGEFEEGQNSSLDMLLFQRARLLSDASNKYVELEKLISRQSQHNFSLIYCGDRIDEEGPAIDRVITLVGKKLGLSIAKYTGVESKIERASALDDFANGRIGYIAAIKCLDEGVDIPRTETAYILASSTNPRQYIQRRGRILRKYPGKKIARIFDFLVLPPSQMLSGGDLSIERKMIEKELVRSSEFSLLARNSGESLNLLRNIKKQYGLLDR